MGVCNRLSVWLRSEESSHFTGPFSAASSGGAIGGAGGPAAAGQSGGSDALAEWALAPQNLGFGAL